jgi:hypothetical protein
MAIANRIQSESSPAVNAVSPIEQRIASLSTIIGIGMVDLMKISGINVGDMDLSATLSRELTQSGSSSSTDNMSSLPVTVIS